MSSTEYPPQVELHVHLDGAFDYETLFNATQKFKDTLPEERTCPWVEPSTGEHPIVRPRTELGDCTTFEAFKEQITMEAADGLIPMLTIFYRYLPLVSGRLELLEELAYKFVGFQAASHVVYTEVRYSPHEFFLEEHKQEPPEGMCRQFVDAVSRGLERGQAEFNVVVRQILCCINFCPQWSLDVVQTAAAARDAGCGVVGVDLASGETHFEDKTGPLFLGHKAALDWAKDHNIPITVHAGEDGPADNVRVAVEEYHAQRIGHGYHILDDADLYRRLCFGPVPLIHLECCPTSSMLTKNLPAEGWRSHSITRFVKDGASMSISSDDPRVFDICHRHEIVLAQEKMGLSREELRRCTEHALKAAFCDEETRKAVGTRIAKWYDEHAA